MHHERKRAIGAPAACCASRTNAAASRRTSASRPWPHRAVSPTFNRS